MNKPYTTRRLRCLWPLALTALLGFLCPGTMQAQQSVAQLCFGYLSYDSVLVSMPEYATTQHRLQELRNAYESELKRVEDEFNTKYEAFLEGQREFPRTILLKRQNELQEIIQRNVAFKQQSLQELEQAREEAMKPLRAQLDTAIARVAREHGFALVVNTDSHACPWIAPELGEDITAEVQKVLNRKP